MGFAVDGDNLTAMSDALGKFQSLMGFAVDGDGGPVPLDLPKYEFQSLMGFAVDGDRWVPSRVPALTLVSIPDGLCRRR